ncbi:MAG: DegQ family serine endoprotease [Alphaproteobacteria bacterium]|nr:DegQ family serine endoprotease [Alphaproteobacteria bacterium]
MLFLARSEAGVGDPARGRPRGRPGSFRRRIGTIAIAVAAALIAPTGAALAQAPRGAPDSFADLAERLLPSVVNISTTQVVRGRERGPGQGQGPGLEIPRFPPGSPFEEFFREFFDRQQRRDTPERRATSLGSGFIIDPAGVIITNNHVIAEADEISVTLQDNTNLKARMVGRDQMTDLAVLKVDPPKPLPAVRFGDSDRSRVGDWVLAIGNPFGLGGSVTAGIISARSRDINSGPYDDFIQTDASINRGNSGGPMFNLAGEVIGVNTAIYSPSGGSVGIGFAIPANLAKPIVAQLQEFGRARRGWIGVRIQTVTEEIAQGLGLDGVNGALVANLTEGGPAEKAKIEVGDVILKFNGKDINEMRTLPRVVAETPVGRAVPIEVWRKGRKVALQVAVGEFPEDEKVAAASSRPDAPSGGGPSVATLGLVLEPMSPDLRSRFKLPDVTDGVVVTKVEDDSPAAERRIRPGDIIRKIGPEQEVVKTPNQVRQKVENARKAKMKTILVLLETEGNQRFVALRVDNKG